MAIRSCLAWAVVFCALAAWICPSAQAGPFELYVSDGNGVRLLDASGTAVNYAPTDGGARGMAIADGVFYTAYQGGAHRQGVSRVDYPWAASPAYDKLFETLDADTTRIYDDPGMAVIGPDGALYVVSTNLAKGIIRCDRGTGQITRFVDGSDWGTAQYMTLGPDATGDGLADFYLSHYTTTEPIVNEVRILDGATGAYVGNLVDSASNGGLNRPYQLAFQTEQGQPYLYVVSMLNDRVKKYDGLTGAFIEDYWRANWVKAGQTATARTYALAFDDTGYLYVTTNNGLYRVDPGGGLASGEHLYGGFGLNYLHYVPEPASVSLLLAGALLLKRRR